MKICLAQMEVVPNKPEKNVARMLEVIAAAKQESADLVVFPEMCVGGYFVGDKWQEENFCSNLMAQNETLRQASKGIAIAYGNVYMDDGFRPEGRSGAEYHPNKDGRARKYNAVYVFQNGKPAKRARETPVLPRGVQPKTLLPEYRIFDDERYFFSTQDIAKDYGAPLESLLQPFLIAVGGEAVPVGFELCEDMWSGDYKRNGEKLNPTRMLTDNGAQVVVNLSASPWTYGKNAKRDRQVSFLSSEAGKRFVPFLYVNCVGVQNNGKDFLLFDGASTVYGTDGSPVMLANSSYAEETFFVETPLPHGKPVRRVERGKSEQQFRGIVRGIRHMNDILGRVPTYVIGLSGGIDSAVVASLLTVAVGKENVVGVNMPTKFNSSQTKESAGHVAEALGIRYSVIPIGELVEAHRALLIKNNKGPLEKTLEQNIQAKIRAQILSNLAESYGGLYTSNGNKWEVATGYSTLDGDARGALAPIGDLTKLEVFEMAQYLNKEVFRAEVVPRELIELKVRPGAELASEQVNPLKLKYHSALVEAFTDFRAKSAEEVMRWYLEGTMEDNLGVSTETLRSEGVDRPEEFVKDIEWFNRQQQRSVFKRVQSPPIILLSRTAYGYDRRESILPIDESPLYRELRAKVLAMKAYAPASAPNPRPA